MKTFSRKAVAVFMLLIVTFNQFEPVVALQSKTQPAVDGVAAQSGAPTQDATTSSIDGMTLGSEIAPDERVPASVVPDFGEQVAAQAKAQPAEAVPLRLKAFAVPAIYIPGKPLQIKWSIDGLSADLGQTLRVPR